MDLTRVRKRIDQGIIRNSQSLQRDLLLIFQNAMMYNSSKTDIYRMALEMEKDVNQQVSRKSIGLLYISALSLAYISINNDHILALHSVLLNIYNKFGTFKQ